MFAKIFICLLHEKLLQYADVITIALVHYSALVDCLKIKQILFYLMHMQNNRATDTDQM